MPAATGVNVTLKRAATRILSAVILKPASWWAFLLLLVLRVRAVNSLAAPEVAA